MWFVERHYLVKYGGSFAETFYGLKRRRTLRSGAESGTEERVKAVHELTGKSDNVRGREIYGSLAFLVSLCSGLPACCPEPDRPDPCAQVVMPYLKTKATDLYERLGGGAEAEIFASSPTSAATPTPLQLLLDSSAAAPALLKRIELASEATFKLAYPYAKLLWQVYLLLYNLRYLFGKSKYWRPWYDWLGIEVRRLGQDDYVRIFESRWNVRQARADPAFICEHLCRPAQERLQSLPTPWQLLTRPPSPSSPPTARPSLRQFLSRLVRLAPHLALDSLRVVLPLAIFGFRLLEWWYSPAGVASRLGRGRKDGAQPALRAPPPAARTAATEGSEATAAAGRGMCVIHGGPVENPTALPSGWIGCYRCLRRLEEEVQVETEVEDGKGGVQTVKGMKGTGKLRDPKTGEWVEIGRLRRIMG